MLILVKWSSDETRIHGTSRSATSNYSCSKAGMSLSSPHFAFDHHN